MLLFPISWYKWPLFVGVDVLLVEVAGFSEEVMVVVEVVEWFASLSAAVEIEDWFGRLDELFIQMDGFPKLW